MADSFSYTSAGYPSSFTSKRVSKLLRLDTEAGYMFSAPSFTRDHWAFTVGWSAMSPNGYIYLTNFFHSHRGGVSFYFTWPTGLAGVSGSTSGLSSDYLENNPGAYETDAGGSYPWSMDADQGFGTGPVHEVFFDMDELEGQLTNAVKNLWSVTVQLRQV